jgi:hypothetical protein
MAERIFIFRSYGDLLVLKALGLPGIESRFFGYPAAFRSYPVRSSEKSIIFYQAIRPHFTDGNNINLSL